MTDTPYTRSLQFNCCKQCMDPETCLATRKQWLEMQLAALSCEICGAIKPDDGDPTCSLECRRKLMYPEMDEEREADANRPGGFPEYDV